MRPASVPRYVQVAETTMREMFGLDLWRLAARDRNRLLVAACDAEIIGEPADADSWVEVAVWDLWKDMQRERKKRN